MKSLKPIQNETRRQYESTFKVEAVQDWLPSGKIAEVAAHALDLKPDRPYA